MAQGAPPQTRQERLQREGVIWRSDAWATPFADDLAEDVKLAGLGLLWAEVRSSFSHFAHVPDLDWDRTFVTFVPRVRATCSTLEYYRALQEMTALLNDAHTGVVLPPALAKTLASPPLRLDLIERRVFVTAVDGQRLQKAGVRPGLELLAIDGVPVHEYANTRRRPYVSSNSRHHADALVYSAALLAGPLTDSVRLELKAPDGTVSRIDVPRTGDGDRVTMPAIEFRLIAPGLGYLAIHTFGSAGLEKEFDALVPRVQTTSGLVIDVRDNGGGSGAAAYNIVSRLTGRSFATLQWKSRQYVPTLRAWGAPGAWYEPPERPWGAEQAPVYDRPIVLLTGPHAISATDVFAEALKRLGRATVVGEPTGGSTGDPLAFPLPGGGFATVATSTEVVPTLIGVGVQPDILVPRTAADIMAGVDRALETAIAVLKGRP